MCIMLQLQSKWVTAFYSMWFIITWSFSPIYSPGGCRHFYSSLLVCIFFFFLSSLFKRLPLPLFFYPPLKVFYLFIYINIFFFFSFCWKTSWKNKKLDNKSFDLFMAVEVCLLIFRWTPGALDGLVDKLCQNLTW